MPLALSQSLMANHKERKARKAKFLWLSHATLRAARF